MTIALAPNPVIRAATKKRTKRRREEIMKYPLGGNDSSRGVCCAELSRSDVLLRPLGVRLILLTQNRTNYDSLRARLPIRHV